MINDVVSLHNLVSAEDTEPLWKRHAKVHGRKGEDALVLLSAEQRLLGNTAVELHQLTLDELRSGLIVYAHNDWLSNSDLTAERTLILLYAEHKFILLPVATGNDCYAKHEVVLASMPNNARVTQCWHHYDFGDEQLTMLYTFDQTITPIEQQRLREVMRQATTEPQHLATEYHRQYLKHWSCLKS